MSLISAAETNDIETARRLLGEGADTEVRNGYLQTPLHIAAGYGRLEFVDLLVRQGADIEAVAHYGHRPLMAAASNRVFWKTDEACERTVALLLSRGPAIDAQDNYGWSALHHAAYDGHVKTAERLLAAGADLRLKNRKGEHPLTLATKRPERHPLEDRATIKPGKREEDSMFEMVKLLLDREMKLRLHWKRRRSLYRLALEHRCPEAAALFA